MVSEAGVPELARHEIPRKLLQPLAARYETALSQLEKTVKVRASTSSACVLVMHPTWEGRQAGRKQPQAVGDATFTMVSVVSQLEGRGCS